MKKLEILFITSIMMLSFSSCKNEEPSKPSAGTLSSVIETDPQLLVNGQWVEFEIEETSAPTSGSYVRKVSWYVNGSQMMSDLHSQDGNKYKLNVLLNTRAEDVTVKVVFTYENASGCVSVYREQTFAVIQPDVHKFLWGDSKDVVEDNIALVPSKKENSLFYPQIKSEYWIVSGKADVIAMYEFDSDEKLIKLTEAYADNLKDDSDISYERVAMRYVHAYTQLSRSFGMNPTVIEWLEQPTEEQISAVEEFIDKLHLSSKEAKIITGKTIVNNQLWFEANSKDSTNTHVRLITGAGSPGSVDFMMTFTPKLK